MRLVLKKVADPGNPMSERLVYRAIGPTDVGRYAIFRVLREGDAVTNAVIDTFWFPDQPVAHNDLVVLYSKNGSYRQRELLGKKKAHFFYWGSEDALWDDPDFVPVIVRIAEWRAEDLSQTE